MYTLPKEGWIAKDEDKRVWLFPHKPRLSYSFGYHHWICESEGVFIGRYVFPDINWEDEPKFCKIRIEFQI